jgi:hypothetical protein
MGTGRRPWFEKKSINACRSTIRSVRTCVSAWRQQKPREYEHDPRRPRLFETSSPSRPDPPSHEPRPPRRLNSTRIRDFLFITDTNETTLSFKSPYITGLACHAISSGGPWRYNGHGASKAMDGIIERTLGISISDFF